MNDLEIKEYLEKVNWSVDSNDFIINVLNTSHQIVNKLYNFDTHKMTIITPENKFTFKWNLKKL